MNLTNSNVATILVLVIAALGFAIVILSAVDLVTDPQLRLSFQDYITAMSVAGGGLAIGRGLGSRAQT